MGKSLSVCMIVKNEERNMERCLQSIHHIADEIIVVDTGSVDNTKSIASKYNVKIYDFQWVDDFSKARNYSIEKANCDWILILDGDDEFEKRDSSRLLELINRKDAADIYIFNTICYVGEKAGNERILNVNIRLFKNIPELRYQGRIHESVVSKKPDTKMETAEITVYHYGYLNVYVKEQEKRKRNMRILKKQLEEQPENPYFLFCMGNEYFALGLAEKSLEYFNLSFEKCNKKDIYVPKLLIRIIMAYQLLKDYNRAIFYIEKALSLYPNYTDVEYIRGSIYHSKGIVTKAIRCFNKCLEMSEPPAVLNFIIGVGTYKAHYALGCIYHQIEDYSEALLHYNQALLIKPDYYDAIYSIGGVLAVTSANNSEFKEKLLKFFDTNMPNNCAMIADISYLQRKYEMAIEFIEKAKQKGLYNEGLALLKAQSYFYLRKYEKAVGVFSSVSNESNHYIKAKTYHCLSLLLSERFKDAEKAIKALEQEEDFKLKHKVFNCLASILSNGEKVIFDEELKASDDLLNVIFEILDLILGTKEFDKFEKALEMLNCIENDKALLLLAKLYNKHGFIEMASKEIIRSIKIFNKVDGEAAFILSKGFSIMNNKKNSF